MNRGTGLDRGTSLGRTAAPGTRGWSTLRPQSPRTADRRAAVAEASAEALARDGECQGPGLVPEVACWGRLDPSHTATRGAHPDLAADPANIVALCRGHHEWVHANPAAARLVGLYGRTSPH